MTDSNTPAPPPTSLSDHQMWMLMQPLHDSRVATRRQSGRDLSYVEAYDIKATLIRMFGFGGFSVEVIESKIIEVRTGFTHGDHNTRQDDGTMRPKTPQVLALSTVRLTIFGIGPGGRDVTYTESSIGSNSANDIGDAADNAIKSAASDALKRCAVYLGTQFGLGLYNAGSRAEIVRQIIEPGQRAQWERIQQQSTPAPDPEAQRLLQQATQAAAQVQPSAADGYVAEPATETP